MTAAERKAPRRRVIVAHEEEALRDAALRIVREAGYEGIGVADGHSARALVTCAPHPVALVVDVGLPGVMAYELVDEIRRGGFPTRVVLVASVFSKTAYKRRPSSLYGADDYVEQHHIPDQLGPKLARVLAAEPAAPPAPRPPADVHDPASLSAEQRLEVEHIRKAGEGRLQFRYGTRTEALERARRLARLILADVVLYNGAAVEAGLAADDLPVRLAADLEEGRQLLALRVPPEIAAAEDFLGAALGEFVASRMAGGAAGSAIGGLP